MHRFSAFWHMRLPHRLQGQKVKSQSHGAGAYCGGDLAAQLVTDALDVLSAQLANQLSAKRCACKPFASCLLTEHT